MRKHLETSSVAQSLDGSWPSGGEPAFPRKQQATQVTPKAQGSSRTFYSGFMFCNVVAAAGTRYHIKSIQMTSSAFSFPERTDASATLT
jgi:hypothetical protein